MFRDSFICILLIIFFIVCPVKDGLSTDVRTESFDDEAFETGRKNQFIVHDIYESCTHVLICWILDWFFHSVVIVLDWGV